MSEQLWAPWRMEYVLSDRKGTACVFCAYANVDEDRMRESLVLVRTEHAYVVLNRYPFAAGHLLIVPRRHAAALEELTGEEHDALFRLARESTHRLKRAVRAEGVNLGVNLGRSAGAGIAEHLHVHVVPRWEGDSNFMPVLADTRVMPQHLDATFTHLYPHFLDLPGHRAKAP